ncbi:hypothetical protein BH11PAT2_BH11PAT2_08570 [soil metagenome]
MELISKEQILAALKKAPPLIREAFGSDETMATILKIQKRYNLHADVLGAVSEELGNLLLGLIDPATFFTRIQERGVNDESAKSIVDDINREIFVPLQKKIKDGVVVKDDEDEDGDEEVATPVATAPATQQPMQPAAPILPPQQRIPVMNIGAVEVPSKAEIVQPSSPLATPPEPPAYNLIRPQEDVPTGIVAQSPALIPQARTMASDMNALTHPESVTARVDQGIAPAAVPHPWQTSPAQSFQTASVPYTAMPTNSRAIPAPPPIHLPTGWAPERQEPVVTRDAVVTERAPIRPKAPSSNEPLTKEYGSDPYREPIT